MLARGGLPVRLHCRKAVRRGQDPSLQTTGRQGIIGENANFRQVCRGRIYASRGVCPLYRIIGAAATGGIYAAPTNQPIIFITIYGRGRGMPRPYRAGKPSLQLVSSSPQQALRGCCGVQQLRQALVLIYACISSKIGIRACPSAVRRYSTRGGTSA